MVGKINKSTLELSNSLTLNNSIIKAYFDSCPLTVPDFQFIRPIKSLTMHIIYIWTNRDKKTRRKSYAFRLFIDGSFRLYKRQTRA